jgi:hypothetical protein
MRAVLVVMVMTKMREARLAVLVARLHLHGFWFRARWPHLRSNFLTTWSRLVAHNQQRPR